MSISINCKLSLSKKLRALLGKDATLTLVSQDIVDGKGTAILILNSEDAKTITNPEELGETSIMLIPIEMAEESPNIQSPVHASIFSTVPSKHQEEPVVQKIAAVHAPEKGREGKAIKKEAPIPQQFPELKQPECKSWISNMEELISAVNVAKGKQANVDLNDAQNDRERAVLMEIKEKAESIDTPAWIINDKVGILSVNDLNISLPLNAPYDLSNISARRVANSKDLRGVIKAGYVRFISPEEKDQIILNIVGGDENTAIGSLAVFDNHEEAMENIGTKTTSSPSSIPSRRAPVISDDSMELTEEDLNTPTEDEGMILNLTQNMATVKSRKEAPSPEVNRKTVHGNSPTTPKPGIKPIRKLD
jgi:hypothetical protein